MEHMKYTDMADMVKCCTGFQ